LKFLIYSAHDDQVDNIMVWMNATNFDFYTIPFASQVKFEMSYDFECVMLEKHESCFKVHTYYNGNSLAFAGCEEGCEYPEFKAFMEGIWYSGYSSTDLNEACNQSYPSQPISRPDVSFL